jgi:RHS repeat-associated protein
MNGRMYDPVLGRSPGVDPFIQNPDNSQGLNGYGYCLNNPLKYSDTSGYTYVYKGSKVNDIFTKP